ncbi:MAG: glycine cleavage system protein R [Oceanospirillaceae bacterium]|uniref:glycine cleavage system protein R n=3 Tax=unclassified Thalassolituus TaxID=2624967 RepID=UPI000C49E075|nr:ACT domain-containing protein [Thalassolituus sp. UBA6592]MAS25048.1 glycine cleavage system protein R [Oceanospirillaceae bacterium]MBL36244.1 glycine cleavage system protein R [Oceanospirillaceae bacterium]MBS53713.1 glycine cleavage system protein R [Oceanospirillaceae bacterium]|tara:strand:- start:42 stop:554 length:513 start_codon:yes stop_codon:yes gene_type:complete
MAESLVLTVIADDKTGIVEQVSKVVAQHGGNWLESRMAHMAGKFAGIVLISVDAAQSADLITALSALSSQGIQVTAESGAVSDDSQCIELTLSLVGNDRPGIVREVSQALAAMNVNVLELTTDCAPAEMSAVPLFKAEAVLRVAKDFDTSKVADALEAISNDLMVEISLD